MALCFYVLGAFLPSLRGWCRNAHPGIMKVAFNRSSDTKRKFGLAVAYTLSQGSNGTGPKAKRTHHGHNAHTRSCHTEARPPSYTWPTHHHLGLAPPRAVDFALFLRVHSSPWACPCRYEVLGARTTCGSVHLAAQSSVGMARKSCGRAKSSRSCLRHPTTPTSEGC